MTMKPSHTRHEPTTASVVIAAHNEEAVIERCLEALTRGAAPGELDIVVVCNGCSDDTADRARAFAYPVRVEETDVASKPNALNLGDGVARGFPRVYVDADVVVSHDAVAAVVAALRSGRCLAAAPRIAVDLEHASRPVRAFYRVWLRLPYHTTEMIGSGVYALSEEGRRRFGEFPDTMAEDTYVRLLFAPGERVSVRDHRFTIFAPRRFGDLVAVKSRARVGRHQLGVLFPDLHATDGNGFAATARRIVSSPSVWPSVPVYYAVTLLSIVRARRLWRQGDVRWIRDTSSRSGTGHEAVRDAPEQTVP